MINNAQGPSTLFWEWGALLLVLAFASYTLYAIKNEKKDYLQNAVQYSFWHFYLPFPHWWHIEANKDGHCLKATRADTRYDWYATFKWVIGPDEKKGPKKKEEASHLLIEKILREKQIILDQKSQIIHGNHSHIMARIEGTATEKDEFRIYLDLCIIRDKKARGVLICLSRSSILNGCVEGPYFEEVITRITEKD